MLKMLPKFVLVAMTRIYIGVKNRQLQAGGQSG
jgi:hypothetical protein